MDWGDTFSLGMGDIKTNAFDLPHSSMKTEDFDIMLPLSSTQLPTNDTITFSQTDLSNGSVHAPSSDSVLGSPSSKDVERFNGLTEEDVKDKVLPDHLKEGLDIVIVGINPSLASASVGHHYAGPGNHFWTCISQAGLVPEMVTCYDDERMLDYGIGFTNVCTRPTKGAAELTRKEMKAGAAIMLEKMRKYRPKIAVFNGKGIYEAYVGHKNFSMGRQPTTLDGTDTTIFVMPSSSARCAQLPRAEDKLPFFVALRKLRDYIRGDLSELPDSEVVFADYTEFRVTQPDPKSLRKAESRKSSKMTYSPKGTSKNVIWLFLSISNIVLSRCNTLLMRLLRNLPLLSTSFALFGSH
ncbi:G/T mismatch-specific thymine DNA glycosylase [Clonorchis sinensis]|uniref:G/T mismatch-specific thymine DNA glycosylase n=1 Tax=Clonorchis sinensis TaxID=79923 RepID=A0A8T1MRL5_CLOSI|nr:G/T mismatch-specific thymine DNA glycosylase [Clonorchis sinensis]